MKRNKPNIILIGGGGHCLSVIDVVEQEGKYNIQGILDQDPQNKKILGYNIIGGDDLIQELVNEGFYFLITVGQIKNYTIREKLAKKLNQINAKVATIISPKAYVSKYASIAKGTIVMHDAFVNAGAKIGEHCIVNTKTNVEHGATIEDFCHLSTASIVNGDSYICRGSFIGSNATISNNIRIQENSIISAGTFIK